MRLLAQGVGSAVLVGLPAEHPAAADVSRSFRLRPAARKDLLPEVECRPRA